MFEGDLFYYTCGAIFAAAGYGYFEKARRDGERIGSKLFMIPLAAWFCYENFLNLISSSHITLKIVAMIAAFCVASPFLGFVWYGRGGNIRKKLLNGLWFLCLFVIFTFIFIVLLGEQQHKPALFMGFALTWLLWQYPNIKKQFKRRQAAKQRASYRDESDNEEALKRQQETVAANQDQELVNQLIESLKK